jgi:DNA-binding NarL/FixJ family response regulator
VILLSDTPRLEDIHPPVRAVLPRDVSPTELSTAIHAVAAGLVVLHPAALATPVSGPIDHGPLTSREIEILGLLAEGQPNKTIAWKLDISEHTVKFHVASILSKLGASSRTEAVTVGLRRGLIFL